LPSRSSTRGHHQQSDVRDGSFSDFDAPKREVHFAPNNGHRQCGAARPISANSRSHAIIQLVATAEHLAAMVIPAARLAAILLQIARGLPPA